jgi:hypothetical protein
MHAKFFCYALLDAILRLSEASIEIWGSAAPEPVVQTIMTRGVTGSSASG